MEIQTSTGHVIFLKKDYLTWDEKKKLKKEMNKQFQFQGLTAEAIQKQDFSSVSIAYDGSGDDTLKELAITFYVDKIRTPEGQEITSDIIVWLGSQRDTIAEEIIEKINTATQKKPDGEKKEATI